MKADLDSMSREELIEIIKNSKRETIKYVNKYLEEEEKRDTLRFVLLKLSHEFKTPLNSIIGFSDVLRFREKDEVNKKYLNNISYSSHHLLSLIQDLLDATRAQYKPLELSKKKFNTASVIKNIIESFDNDCIKYTLSNVQVFADEMRFRQVVYNLISNAVKFNTFQKTIQIITYVDKNFVFEISDSGDGIKEEDISIIFDFFAQASESAQKRQIGSGVGLSLSKSIIEAHGGEIGVVSKENIGSTFWFSIPLND